MNFIASFTDQADFGADGQYQTTDDQAISGPPTITGR